MAITFDPKIPIYIQLASLMTGKIISGHWAAGDKVDSVRDLAVFYQVNPNTVQRALSEMEREGLVYSERTSGRFITNDEKRLQIARETRAQSEISRFVNDMQDLGYDPDACIELLKKYVEEGAKRV